MTTFDLLQVAHLFYPIMLTQEMGEISESKACELLGMTHEDYRELKCSVSKSVLNLLESLPCPLTLLLENMKGRPKSSTGKK